METANIGMYHLLVLGNVTCVVVRNMSVVMHHPTCVHAVGIKGINTNTVHNKSGLQLQENHQLYYLCSHGRKVL